MNKARRSELSEIVNSLQEIRDRVDMILEAEQEAYDNLPEGIQEGERGEAMEVAIDALNYAVEALDDVEGYIEEAIDQ